MLMGAEKRHGTAGTRLKNDHNRTGGQQADCSGRLRSALCNDPTAADFDGVSGTMESGVLVDDVLVPPGLHWANAATRLAATG